MEERLPGGCPFLPTTAESIMKRRNSEIDHIDPRWEEGRNYQLVCGLDCLLNYREEDPRKNSAKSNRFLPWRVIQEEIGTVPVGKGDLCLFLIGADIEKDIPGEWVLMEFLSEEWFRASIGTCSRSHREIDQAPLEEGRRRWRQNNPEEYEANIQNFIQSGRNWIEENKELHSNLVLKGRRKFSEENPEWEMERTQKAIQGFKEWFSSLTEEELEQRSLQISEATKKAMSDLTPEKREVLVHNGRENAKKQHEQRWMCTVTGYITTPAPLSRYQKKRGIDPSNRIRIK